MSERILNDDEIISNLENIPTLDWDADGYSDDIRAVCEDQVTATDKEWKEWLMEWVGESRMQAYVRRGEPDGCKCATCVAIYEKFIAGTEETV